MRPTLTVPLTLALLLGGAVATTLPPLPAAHAAVSDDLIAKLKEAVKAGDDAAAESAIEELDKIKKEDDLEGKVAEALAGIARSPTLKSDKVFKLAVKAAAGKKHEGLLTWIKGKLDDKKMIENKKERYLAILDAIALYGDDAKVALGPLEDVVKKHFGQPGNGIEIAKRGVIAYGSVRTKPVVEQLIKWLTETEKSKGGGGQGGGGGGGGKSLSEEAKKAYAEVNGVVLKTLEKLTGEEMGDSAQWAKWWKENERTFEFPDPNANTEPDWENLVDYPDRMFGFTMKKPIVGKAEAPADPDGKFWKFAKNAEKDGRATLTYRDDQNYLHARCNIWNVKTWNKAQNLEQLMAVFEEAFREKEFEKFSKEPEIKSLKIGGREFMVITARGAGKERWKDWDSCERRIYATMPNTGSFLYFECVVRGACEEPLRNSLWSSVEHVEFTPKK